MLPISPASTAQASEPEDRTPAPTGRLRPPEPVRCDYNQLTSFSGIVSAYERKPGATRIAIRTERDSEEIFTLSHPDGRPEVHFLLRGAPFSPEDWDLIEQSPGNLSDELQAIVWVCEDDAIEPLIDWRPGEGRVSR